MNLRAAVVGCLAATFLAGTAWADVHHVGLDVSDSTMLVHDPQFARAAANWVEEQLRNRIQNGDVVEVQYFGNPTMAGQRRIRLAVTRRNSPAEVARAVALIIRSVPDVASSNPRFAPHQQTNIVEEIRSTVRRLRFEAPNEGRVLWLLTDGWESSAVTDATQFRQSAMRGSSALPPPDRDLLAGTTFIMFGVGQISGSNNAAISESFSNVWERWARQAGAGDVHIFTTF